LVKEISNDPRLLFPTPQKVFPVPFWNVFLLPSGLFNWEAKNGAGSKNPDPILAHYQNWALPLLLSWTHFLSSGVNPLYDGLLWG